MTSDQVQWQTFVGLFTSHK